MNGFYRTTLALVSVLAFSLGAVTLPGDAWSAPGKKNRPAKKTKSKAKSAPVASTEAPELSTLPTGEKKGFYVLSLIKGGKPVHKLNLTRIQDKIQPNTIIVYDPFSDNESVYRAFRFNLILTIFFGHGWQDWDELLFKADDGYEATVPVERFVKHTSYLAFDRTEDHPFEHVDKLNDRGKVSLGPYYLTWENLQDLTMKDEGATGWTPRIRSIELIKFADRYPRMAPPKEASRPVREGFLAFRKHCVACHTINGEGGTTGDAQRSLFELNYPVSVTEFIKSEWLERWIDHPKKIRYNTAMPRLDPELRDRDLVIRDLLAYLLAMSAQKREPAMK